MRSLFRSEKYSRGWAGGPPALPPAMTPRELAMVEAYFDRRTIAASWQALVAAIREAPPRRRGKG